MILHTDMGKTAFARTRQLKKLLDSGSIKLAGNCKLKIYGTLNCSSGKRIKIENRLFFESATEAISAGYRPCGHCMKEAYQKWKALN